MGERPRSMRKAPWGGTVFMRCTSIIGLNEGQALQQKFAVKSLTYISGLSYRPEKQRTVRPNPLLASWRPTRLELRS